MGVGERQSIGAYLILVYQLLVYPMIGQLLQVTLTLGFICAESNKHFEHMKPSFTAPFDVLTFDILTWDGHNNGHRKWVWKLVDWGIWKDAYRLSPSLFQPFFAHSLFHCLLIFFSCLHWQRAWHRLSVFKVSNKKFSIFTHLWIWNINKVSIIQ